MKQVFTNCIRHNQLLTLDGIPRHESMRDKDFIASFLAECQERDYIETTVNVFGITMTRQGIELTTFGTRSSATELSSHLTASWTTNKASCRSFILT